MTELTLTAFSLPTDLQHIDSPRHVSLFPALLDKSMNAWRFQKRLEDMNSHHLVPRDDLLLGLCSLAIMAFDQHLCQTAKGLHSHD